MRDIITTDYEAAVNQKLGIGGNNQQLESNLEPQQQQPNLLHLQEHNNPPTIRNKSLSSDKKNKG